MIRIVSLLDLPNEIIEGIFGYVREDDILQLKLASTTRAFANNPLTSMVKHR